MRKGISPLMATVMLVLIAVTLATIIGPWMYELVRDRMNQTDDDSQMEIRCETTAYDFNPSYANSGINWSATDPSLRVMITNTGQQKLYNFSFELTLNSSTAISYFNVTAATQRTKEYPLNPGESALLEADSLSSIAGSSLTTVKVLNRLVCPKVYVQQDV